MKVKIIKHCGVEYDGVLHGPDSEPFDLPDEMAAGLVERGTCEAVVELEPELIIVSHKAFVPSDEQMVAESDTSEVDADTPDEPVATPDEPDTSEVDAEPEPTEEPDEDTVDEPKRKKRGRRKRK